MATAPATEPRQRTGNHEAPMAAGTGGAALGKTALKQLQHHLTGLLPTITFPAAHNPREKRLKTLTVGQSPRKQPELHCANRCRKNNTLGNQLPFPLIYQPGLIMPSGT